ncbi:hypothetical protein QOZ80_7BG0586300 [Eleusine coracana subsp. coracana]|nr:hypothetical protein QOZ80_7BG0586300 [Eleusine coracana subsp. coracana]
MNRWFGRRSQRSEHPATSSAGSSSSSSSRSRALLLECAGAMAAGDTERANQLMSMVSELASPHGDLEQRLASYFLQALLALHTGTGPRTLRTLVAAGDGNTWLESTRRATLRFLDASPWASFGHVAANGAILEAFFLSEPYQQQQRRRLHILDLSNTFCTQWPAFLDALSSATQEEHAPAPPHVTLTAVVTTPPSAPTDGGVQRVVREVKREMRRCARLMRVPFTFRAVHHAGDLADLDLDALVADDLQHQDTTLAVNCVNALRCVGTGGSGRDAFVSSIRRLGPRVVTVVEEEADLVADYHATATSTVFSEALRFFAAYLDALEAVMSGERLVALEDQAGRAIVDVVACPPSESGERREPAASWARRMSGAGFAPAPFSRDVANEMGSLLTHYREGRWSLQDAPGTGKFLAWKDQPVVWASAWRP